jgi:hypothetical protein
MSGSNPADSSSEAACLGDTYTGFAWYNDTDTPVCYDAINGTNFTVGNSESELTCEGPYPANGRLDNIWSPNTCSNSDGETGDR